jgi:hypothetical protein
MPIMLGIGAATRVYLAIGATDMRKGFEGLFGIDETPAFTSLSGYDGSDGRVRRNCSPRLRE